MIAQAGMETELAAFRQRVNVLEDEVRELQVRLDVLEGRRTLEDVSPVPPARPLRADACNGNPEDE